MSNKSSDFDILMEHGIDIRGRIIYLQGDVDKAVIHSRIKLLNYLDKTTGDITVVLDTEGGDVNLGFSFYDELRDCRNEVTIRVSGVAMSMGSIILQSGDKRTITKNSKIMIHRGEMAVEGHFTDVQRAVADNKDMDDRCVNIYLEKIKESKPKFSRSQVQKMMDFDTYISAQRALELGLVDEIVGE
jgi:ATP-dependent Clp protease protease subunit